MAGSGSGGGLLLVAMANRSNSKRRWWNHFVTGAWAKILSAADWANHTGLNFSLRSALVHLNDRMVRAQHNQQNKCLFILHLCICLGSVSCWDGGSRHRNHFGKVWKTVPTAGKSSRLATNFPEKHLVEISCGWHLAQTVVAGLAAVLRRCTKTKNPSTSQHDSQLCLHLRWCDTYCGNFSDEM